MTQPMLDLDNIQGDVVVGLQKDCEVFLFFKIVDPPLFKKSMRLHVVSRIPPHVWRIGANWSCAAERVCIGKLAMRCEA